ncbi:CDP-alcohol phosphatidyltransferase family protein [Taibaiella soli]|uniref:CDP-alcohol phosphatidyltransferase n=1 Tax=Taibaiella soli TaxID=1649169 RepID=A0A2W2A6Z7_9BACT|nr:CDP-alcohol phosphatidyltransferase family protein [Taibaiella soli]PZF71085.1 CDP-alcohol phosphatidyltransferase [Taibaiella soli]
MKHIPITLIFSRLLVAIWLILASILHIQMSGWLVITLFSYALVSDIFDGIIARRLNVSTPLLRRLDSSIDQVFWISAAVAMFIKCPEFWQEHSHKIILLLCFEAFTYVVSFWKFRKEVATHAIASKIWTLTLFATMVEIMASCHSNVLFEICFYGGVLTRIEIIAILLFLREWTNDVPSFYHAIQLRQGKTIRRNKIFNG